ncbi:MAG: M1 family metallopeptidase [bacterium]
MRHLFSILHKLPPPPKSARKPVFSHNPKTIPLVAFVLVLIAAIPAQSADQKPTIRNAQLRRLYHSLRLPVFADSSWILTDTLRLSFPDLRLTLPHGTLTPLYDSTHVITGLLFEGEAQVNFRPRLALERFQLERFTKDSVLSCDASRVLLRMVETAGLPVQDDEERRGLAALMSKRPKTKSKNRRQSEELQRTLEEGLRERNDLNLAARMLARKLAPSAEFVLCAFYPEHGRNFSPPLHVYLYDANTLESIAFYSYFPKRIGRQFFTLCSYTHSSGMFNPTALIKPTKYNGWVALDEDGLLQADMGVDLFTGEARPPALSFALSADLKVSRISAEAGDTLDFVQEPEEAGVTVFLRPYAWQSDTLRLLFQYEGQALRRHENSTYFLKDPINWAPRAGYLERAHYQIIFKVPRRQRVLAVGELVRDWEEAGHHLSFFKTVAPAKAATFCMGDFQTDTLMAARPGLPAIVMNTTGQRSHQERRRVAGDLANSLYFFGAFLGEYPLPCLRVVEAPTIHSQGFPGFVTLSWIGFTSHLEGGREALRGHEVAHQWFGNQAGWRTYHDQWLSESFAEYLGAMYVEWLARSPEQFEQILQAWRDDALDRGHIGANLGMQQFGLGKVALRNAEGLKAGPIWMGARLGQNEVLDYYTQTYEKGAYVVHMLRWLLRDLNTGSDERFWNMLADYIAYHRHREPATEDFQRIAEKHYGASLDWFFQQWIFDNQIPTYRWQYDVKNIPAATPSLPAGMPVANALATEHRTAQVARIRVQQEEVSSSFRMFVPIRVEWDDSTHMSVRLWVTQAGAEIDIPLAAGGLKRVVFNAGDAVLCRIVNETEDHWPAAK